MLTWKLSAIEDIIEPSDRVNVNRDEIDFRVRTIERFLLDHLISMRIVNYLYGPSFVRFGFEPHLLQTRRETKRARISDIEALDEALAIELGVKSVRISPVPERKYVGIEVPHKKAHPVTFWTALKDNVVNVQNVGVNFVLGIDVRWQSYIYEMAKMPYLLITGMAESGKSTCLNSILTYLLLSKTPSDLQILIIDLKRTELIEFGNIPHLMRPIITTIGQVPGVLQTIQKEIDDRFNRFSQVGVRNIKQYNLENQPSLPYILVMVNEVGEILTESLKEAERSLIRFTLKGSDAGVYFIITTEAIQKEIFSRLNRITSFTRATFALPSSTYSEMAFRQAGAEKLIRPGDMLFKGPDQDLPIRLQSIFVSDEETEKLTDYWKKQVENHINEGLEA